MPAWKEIERDHQRLVSLRAVEEPLWLDLARMLEEDGGDLQIRNDTSRKRQDTYDSTPLYAKDDFVGGLFTEAMNPAERFFSYGIEDTDLEKWGPVADWLWRFADLTFATLDPASSNFYLQATPWLGDMAAFGPGFLWQEEDLATAGFIDLALPVREMYKAVDDAGETNRIHRAYYRDGAQLRERFGAQAPAARDDEHVKIVHALYRNPEYRPGALGQRGKAWVSCYASPDKPNFSVEKGYFEFPVHEIQWKRRGGRPWPTGPGHSALADMNMLDEMQRSIMVSTQFEAEPMFLVHDEDVMTAADIQPSGIIAGGMNGNGKENVKILGRGDNLHLPMAAVEQVRNQVRSAFKFSLLQIVNRPQMTLGEFMGWKEEKLRLLAPHLVCIHRGLASFISRRARIMMRQAQAGQRVLPPPPPELQNQPIKVKFVSPFAQVQKASKARNAIQVGNAAIALQPLKPDVGDVLNADNILRTISDGLAGDPGLVNDPKAVEQLRQQRAAAQQPDVQLGRDAQQASIVADVAHAQQAMTSAKQRGGKAA